MISHVVFGCGTILPSFTKQWAIYFQVPGHQCQWYIIRSHTAQENHLWSLDIRVEAPAVTGGTNLVRLVLWCAGMLKLFAAYEGYISGNLVFVFKIVSTLSHRAKENI